MEVVDAEPLKTHADNVSKMKEFLRDYDKIVEIDKKTGKMRLSRKSIMPRPNKNQEGDSN